MESRVKTLEYSLKASAYDQALQLAAELVDEGEDLQLYFSLPSKDALESRLPELRVIARTSTSERLRPGQLPMEFSGSVPYSKTATKAATQVSRQSGNTQPRYTVQPRDNR